MVCRSRERSVVALGNLAGTRLRTKGSCQLFVELHRWPWKRAGAALGLRRAQTKRSCQKSWHRPWPEVDA